MQRWLLHMMATCALALVPPAMCIADASDDGLIEFSAAEIGKILQHGPWPPPWAGDPSNRASGRSDAIEFGEQLFFDSRMSARGVVSCSSCHVPERDWSDGLPRGVGMSEVDRNTPNLVNVRYQRWYGWDGAADSLWSQSMRPILDARELGATPQHVAGLVRNDRELGCRFAKVFGRRASEMNDETVLVNVGKVLAAFQETFVAAPTRFDDFRDALARGDRVTAARYSPAARRGLRIFIGKGNCNSCHAGPQFSNGEFHNIGVSPALPDGRVDHGRPEGLNKLLASRFNLSGQYNDERAAAVTRQAANSNRQPRTGDFRVPSLRNAALTGPYMHNGRFRTLRDVVRHYSGLDMGALGADRQAGLGPLRLTAQETNDLVVFLESLTDYRTTWRRNIVPDQSACD